MMKRTSLALLSLLALAAPAQAAPEKAAIFGAHKELLADEGTVQDAVSRILDGHGAAWAYQQATNERIASPGVKLHSAGFIVSPTTATLNTRLQFPNPQGLIAPGMFLHADLIVGDVVGRAREVVDGRDGRAQPRRAGLLRSAGRGCARPERRRPFRIRPLRHRLQNSIPVIHLGF